MALRGAEAREYRFGGHQTFALRTAWLPKAADAIERGIDPLSDAMVGVVELGLGKNMVEALRCWGESFGVFERLDGVWRLTDEGAAVLGARGYDPYLEDPQTLWWLHWRISTQVAARFFAWELLVNRWNEPFFDVPSVLAAFAREGERIGRPLSAVTLKQHLDVWLRTYCQPRRGRVAEDELDGPLASLGFVRSAGERLREGRAEACYAFDMSPKRSIGQPLFRYCLVDWWARRDRGEDTAPLDEAVTGAASPGRVFRMPASEVRSRLAALTEDPRFEFDVVDSLNQQQLRRRRRLPDLSGALREVFSSGAACRLGSRSTEDGGS